MTRNEFRNFWHLHRNGVSSLAGYRGVMLADGRGFLDVMRELCWKYDPLAHRAEMARFHGRTEALRMTVRRG